MALPSRTPAATPSRRQRHRGVLLATLVGVLGVVAGLFVGLTSGRVLLPAAGPALASRSPVVAGGLGAPHGPRTVAGGVPAGYTDDAAGAATAASNAVQVRVAAAHGHADPAAVSALLAAEAGEATRRAFIVEPQGGGADETNKLPVAARVTAEGPSDATVQVWVVAVASAPTGAGTALTAQAWSTETYQLLWQRGDWRVRAVQAAPGPLPGDPAAPAGPLTTGLFTFYVN